MTTSRVSARSGSNYRCRLTGWLEEMTDAANLDRKIGTATVAVNEARQTLRRAADGNQVYRLAASWYRVDPTSHQNNSPR